MPSAAAQSGAVLGLTTIGITAGVNSGVLASSARLQTQPITSSISNAELSSRPESSINQHQQVVEATSSASRSGSLEGRVDTWNPFEEQPFSQMTEDHIFEVEFDKIRQRGSQGSKCKRFNACELNRL